MNRLIVSPRADARLRVATEWLGRWPRDAETLIIGPTWHACDDALRGVVATGGTRFGAARFTLDRLATLLAAPTLARNDHAPATSLSLAAVTARAVHGLNERGALQYFAPVALRPGFAHAVARTLEELRMNGIDLETLSCQPRGCRDLAEIAAAAARELAGARLADRAALFAAARQAIEQGEAPKPVGLPLLLLDLPLATRAEAELVAALARRAPEALATAPTGDRIAIERLAETLGCGPEAAAEPIAGETSRSPSSLAALQSYLFETSSPPAGVLDDSVRLTSSPGESRECIEIARAIQDEAARGVPFDRMAIFLRSPSEYRSHLQEALGRAAIPAFFARGTAQPEPAGRAFLALLACAAEDLSARRFSEYLSLAQVPDPERRERAVWMPPDHDLQPIPPEPELPQAQATDDPLPRDPDEKAVLEGTLRAPWRWEQLLVDASVIGGRDRWARRLAGLEQELRLQRRDLAGEDARAAALDRSLADLAHLRDFALPLIDRLAALPRDARWEQWLDELRALATAALRHPEMVLATLIELEPMGPIGPVDLDAIQHVLGPRLRDLTLPPERRRYGAVFVAPVEAARGLAFDVVFVPGLAEKLFPRKIVEDPILSDAIRRDLDGGSLPTQERRGAEERLALRLAAGAARERLYLSYPRLDSEQARPRVPSFYALEALQAIEGRLPGFDELRKRAEAGASIRLGWPAPERAEDAIDEAEYDLAVLAKLRAADPEATIGAASYLLNVNPTLARALRARARRWIKRWTPADGLVDPDELARAALERHQMQARSFSPTALENYSVCPYRFFLQAIHRLEPREEPVAIETIDPLTRGALFHEVQFEVSSWLRDQGLLPLTTEALAKAFDAIDAAVDHIAERYADQLAPAIPRVWEDGIGAIRADLREWLRRSAAASDGFVPHRFELSFGLADRHRPNADPASVTDPVPVLGDLKLRGSIDLVERHPAGRLRVTDHKTGKARAKEGTVIGGGKVLQPVLYALASERLLDEPVESGQLYYCTAAGGFEQRVVPLDDESREAMKNVVETVAKALADGFLPAYPDKGACNWCDYRQVCGPWEESRITRKPKDRVAPLIQLRSQP
ncbi:MAG TPA: PD-(D/E)XK nuclease family protein [Candidatus Limnocylindria bacterium]|nr:PD-(D/E)XK nuclease family protein [Candidatus Limnocylindria bacterium]